MKHLVSTLFFFLVVMIVSFKSFAQTLPQSETDFIANLKAELSLTDLQFLKADSICTKAFFDTQLINKELQSMARSDAPQEEKNQKTAVNNQKKKDIREMRDLEVRMLLSDEQKKIYDEKIKPEKPQVLHFGMNHERANCNVCNY